MRPDRDGMKTELTNFRFVAVAVLFCISIYFISYLFLMVPNRPALDSTLITRARSSPRYSIVEMRYKGILVLVGRVSWLNDFYAPLDWVYYQLFPSTVQLGISWAPPSESDR